VPVTRKKRSAAEKAAAVARMAGWLAEVYAEREPPKEIARALDTALEAMSIFGDVGSRNQVCAVLSYTAHNPMEDPVGAVRGFLDAIFEAPEYPFQGTTEALTDATIVHALKAWRRRQGPTSKAERNSVGATDDKFAATAALFRECGVHVTREALSKGWTRAWQRERN
jgi:hypothetical protein